MIPSGAKVLLASHPVDFRKGPDGLVALVRDAGADPFSGALYVFRAKRADRIKIVWWDGTGFAFTPNGWRKHISAGRGLASTGCNSIRRSCWRWSTDSIGRRSVPCW
jgi:hypothetical protein